jgi:hypothetical protein
MPTTSQHTLLQQAASNARDEHPVNIELIEILDYFVQLSPPSYSQQIHYFVHNPSTELLALLALTFPFVNWYQWALSCDSYGALAETWCLSPFGVAYAVLRLARSQPVLLQMVKSTRQKNKMRPGAS